MSKISCGNAISGSKTKLGSKDGLNSRVVKHVHQMIAAPIIRIAINAIRFKRPKYIYELLAKKCDRGRNKDKLVVPRCRLNLRFEGFHYQAVRLMNMLPRYIIEEPSNKIRKRLVKKWVIMNITIHP